MKHLYTCLAFLAFCHAASGADEGAAPPEKSTPVRTEAYETDADNRWTVETDTVPLVKGGTRTRFSRDLYSYEVIYLPLGMEPEAVPVVFMQRHVFDRAPEYTGEATIGGRNFRMYSEGTETAEYSFAHWTDGDNTLLTIKSRYTALPDTIGPALVSDIRWKVPEIGPLSLGERVARLNAAMSGASKFGDMRFSLEGDTITVRMCREYDDEYTECLIGASELVKGFSLFKEMTAEGCRFRVVLVREDGSAGYEHVYAPDDLSDKVGWYWNE